MDYPRLSDLTTSQLQRHQTADLMRVLSAKAFAGGSVADYYREHWPRSVHLDAVTRHFEAPYTKAGVNVGTTADVSWAAPLVTPPQLLDGFVPLVRAASVLGRLPVSRAPFNVKIAKQTAGSSTQWVGEGLPKPISKLGFGSVSLPWSKCSSIIVVTRELLKLSAPESVDQLQATIRDEVVVFVDTHFLSTTAAVPTVSPAGILNGVTPITATANLAADLASLIAAFFAARPRPLAPVVILSPAVVAKVAPLDLGRDVTTNGGTLFGLPVVVSSAAGANAIVADAETIYVADGGLDLDVSPDALVQMDSAPTAPTAATVMVSLWQDNLVGIRVERFIHWTATVSGAVQYLAVA